LELSVLFLYIKIVSTMQKYILSVLVVIAVLSLASCKKGPHCPAYDSVHNTKDYGDNPNNAQRAKEDNKKDIEKRKDAALNEKPPKRSKAYSLFPKGMR
jgi:predicted small lipoprotein YifL